VIGVLPQVQKMIAKTNGCQPLNRKK